MRTKFSLKGESRGSKALCCCSSFRSCPSVSHAVGGRKLWKLHAPWDLAHQLSVPPDIKPHMAGRQPQHPLSLATDWEPQPEVMGLPVCHRRWTPSPQPPQSKLPIVSTSQWIPVQPSSHAWLSLMAFSHSDTVAGCPQALTCYCSLFSSPQSSSTQTIGPLSRWYLALRCGKISSPVLTCHAWGVTVRPKVPRWI
jgi:hypothetical protein